MPTKLCIKISRITKLTAPGEAVGGLMNAAGGKGPAPGASGPGNRDIKEGCVGVDATRPGMLGPGAPGNGPTAPGGRFGALPAVAAPPPINGDIIDIESPVKQ